MRSRVAGIFLSTGLALGGAGCFEQPVNPTGSNPDITTITTIGNIASTIEVTLPSEPTPALTLPRTTLPQAPETTAPLDVANPDCVYKIQPGDTLSEIASNTNNSVDGLVQENNIPDPDDIEAGQLLDICKDGVSDITGGPVEATTTSTTVQETTTTAAPETTAIQTPQTTVARECPASVQSAEELSQECRSIAAMMIASAGYYNIQAYQHMIGITDYSQQTSSVGPRTYNAVMKGTELHITSTDLSEHVDISINRQIIIFYVGGIATVISRISSGSGEQYTYVKDNGETATATAITRLSTGRKINELHDENYYSSDLGGPIGSMAWAVGYGDGGIKIHSGALPGYPASHGCIRTDRGNPDDPYDDALKLMRDKGLGEGDAVNVYE